MADHDPLCPQRHQYRGHKSRCICVLLAAARADERERIVGELDGPARESEAMYAHACEQRDAARADAIRYSDEIDTMVRELSSIRMEHDAEVAALRRLVPIVYGMGRDDEASALPMREFDMRDPREVLADLRAKADECSTLADVLALIDGGGSDD